MTRQTTIGAHQREVETVDPMRSPQLGDRLACALRNRASGVYCAEAAVELLIAHRTLLFSSDFMVRFVEQDGSTRMAVVRWTACFDALERGELGCSATEGQVLGLAASLACGSPVDLNEALCGLDVRNARLVAEAVLRATGQVVALAQETSSTSAAAHGTMEAANRDGIHGKSEHSCSELEKR